MKRHLAAAAGAVGAIASALTWTAPSRAQDDTTAVTQPAYAPVQATSTTVAPVTTTTESTPVYTGPNRALIGTGLVTFVLAYVPAVIVAGTSDTSADHHLYVPVVGPWLDLGNRPQCGAGSVACDTETTDKVLLAIDGVFQGVGVLTTVVGFLMPERETVVTTTTAKNADKPTLHLSPAEMGHHGYGLAALGTF